jgi:anti-sigma B factor antagonist
MALRGAVAGRARPVNGGDIRDATPARAAARVEVADDTALVALDGEHDLATIDLVRDAFAAAEAAEPRVLVVDLAACQFMDSTIVRALLLARERAEAVDRRLALIVADQDDDDRVVATTLSVSGVGALFEIFPTRDQALGAQLDRPPSRRDPD